MERSRPTAAPPRKDETYTPPDFGASVDNERRCRTCACHISIDDPNRIGATQSLCRRSPVTPVMMSPKFQGGTPTMSLTYSPTAPELTCFDGWRPMDTPPGRA